MRTVDLSQFFPWAFLLHFVVVFIAFNIVNAIFKSKYNSFLTFLVMEVVVGVYTYICTYVDLRYEVFMSTIGILLMFLVVCLMTYGKPLLKLLSVIFSYIVYTLVVLLLSVIIPNGTYYSTQYEVPLWYILLVLMASSTSSFIFVAIIKFYKNKNRSVSQRIRNVILLIFPITHFFCMMMATCTIQCLTIEEYNKIIEIHPNFDNFIYGICIVCFLIDFSIIFVLEYIDKLETASMEKERLALKSQMNYQQTKLLEEEKSQFSKIKHDMINILTTAKGFIEIGKPEKALNIISQTNDDLLNISGFQMCSNETINTVLYIKQKTAQQYNIDMKINIDEQVALKINDYDLCRLLHNAVDNALNAAFKTENENKYVNLDICITDEKFIISTENNYNDNDKKKKIRKDPNHGNGINIIKEICSKYGGEYISSQDNGVWYTKTYLDNKTLSSATPPPAFCNDFRVI